ncbi:MAG TPA: response regulator [Kofleriaceae bacterium]
MDDDEDILKVMQDVMERRGYEVIAVDSGADALALLAHDVPDLILLDLEMYDVNGWEVLGALERHPRFGQFRVVVVSGASGRVPKWAGHLKKPFRVEALEELLAQG